MVHRIFSPNLNVDELTLLKVSFNFGSETWPINPLDFLYAQEGSICYGAIMEINSPPGNPDWIVGDAFLVSILSSINSNYPCEKETDTISPEKYVLHVPIHTTRSGIRCAI
jgi:hypothetical protein